MQTENCTQQERSELAAVCADLVFIWKKKTAQIRPFARRKSERVGILDVQML